MSNWYPHHERVVMVCELFVPTTAEWSGLTDGSHYCYWEAPSTRRHVHAPRYKTTTITSPAEPCISTEDGRVWPNESNLFKQVYCNPRSYPEGELRAVGYGACMNITKCLGRMWSKMSWIIHIESSLGGGARKNRRFCFCVCPFEDDLLEECFWCSVALQLSYHNDVLRGSSF